MKRKEIKAFLKKNGFRLHKRGTNHFIWMKGSYIVTMSDSNRVKPRNLKLMKTIVKRANEEEARLKEEESASGSENDEETEQALYSQATSYAFC